MNRHKNRKYRRTHDLPHWDIDGRTQFITFRQADSLPSHVVLELLRTEDDLETIAKLHRFLDAGYGSCLLRRQDVYEIVESALWWLHDNRRIVLDEYVIMPNHLHLIAKFLASLESVMHSLKSFTSNEIRKIVPGNEAFWQRSYFDRLIRDEDHLYRARRYIRANPKAAGLVDDDQSWPLWKTDPGQTG